MKVHFPRALAIVAAHGATDVNEASCLWDYASVFCLLCYSPAPITMSLFLSASVVHFARDVGEVASCLLHVCVGAVGCAFGKSVAFSAMTLYVLVVHVPAHYRRCYARRRSAGLVAAALATALALARTDLFKSFTVSEQMQRIVIAHVVHELKLDNSFVRNN